MLHWATGRADVARPFAEQAEAVCRAVGDTRGTAWAHISLGLIADYQNEPALAHTRLEEAGPLAQEAGDMPQLSLALSCLGRVVVWANGPHDPRAASTMERSLAVAQAAHSRHASGQALSALGELAWRQGDVGQATRLWQQTLEVRRELRDRRGIATSLLQLALSAAAGEQFQRAAWLSGAAEAQRTAIGLVLRHDEEADLAHISAAARLAMGEAEFAAVRADGRAASAEDAVTCALGEGSLPSATPASATH
jgi:hypothetical protein